MFLGFVTADSKQVANLVVQVSAIHAFSVGMPRIHSYTSNCIDDLCAKRRRIIAV